MIIDDTSLTSYIDDQAISITDTQPPPQPPEELAVLVEISLRTMKGRSHPATLRIKGTIIGRDLVSLLDGGSTHNFLQLRLAKFLGLTMTPTQRLIVTVGNRHQIPCKGHCHQVPLVMAQHKFLVNFHLIPFHGPNLVLGVQWLRGLGPTIFYYNKLYMSFHQGAERITLAGLREGSPT